MPESDPNHSSDSEDPLHYATDYHAPVLSHDVRTRLITMTDGRYVDATLGGGGHAQALLDELGTGGAVLGIDRDADALATARDRLREERDAGRFRAVRGAFGNLQSVLEAEEFRPVDGLLLDLGVSSYQIDDPERGFSFQEEGPLDMRMDERQGLTAGRIVNDWPEADLRQALRDYGEERRAGMVAHSIVGTRPLDTTRDLADAVQAVVPPPDEMKTLARVFQALRIIVNAELEQLEQVLEQSTEVVRPGGRIAVISYHSLEDRRAKRFLRYGNFDGTPRRDLYGNLVAPWEETPRGPIEADEAEVEANSRARSARLRVAERRENEDVGPPMP